MVGWQPIHQALSDDYDVIAFDLPGFGGSPALSPGSPRRRRPWPMPSKGSWIGLAWPSSTPLAIPLGPGSPSN